MAEIVRLIESPEKRDKSETLEIYDSELKCRGMRIFIESARNYDRDINVLKAFAKVANDYMASRWG